MENVDMWIELHQELRGHPKIIRLATEMKSSVNEAMGCVVNLWLWVSLYAKDGDLSGFSVEEISSACCSLDKNILKLLIQTGWIDEKNSKKTVHDWKKHGIKLLESNKERVRKHRKNKELENVGDNYGNVTVTATLPNLPNLPNLTNLPNHTVPTLCDYVIKEWNNIAKTESLPLMRELTLKRKTGIITRMKEKSFDLVKIFEEIKRSDFLRGSTGWRVHFDFVFCSANNYLKILEGNYRNGKQQKSEPESALKYQQKTGQA